MILKLTPYQQLPWYKRWTLKTYWSIRLFPRFLYDCLKCSLCGMPDLIPHRPISFSWIRYLSMRDYHIGNTRLLKEVIKELREKIEYEKLLKRSTDEH